MSPAEPAVLAGAFMAGLLGSGHCFAMCGGIAGSLGALAARPGISKVGGSGVSAALQFNGGRLFGYGLLGGVAGAALGMAGRAGGLPGWGLWLRGLSAVLILAIGLHYLTGWQGLRVLERVGGQVWQQIAPVAARAGKRGDAAGRLLLGACWGLLPCGLVYTVLLTAAATGEAVAGFTTMLAFGLGTLPSMLGLTLAAPGFATLLSDRVFRRFVGLSLILLAAWMAFTLWASAAHPLHGAHS